jgi:hypothetical protein
VQAPLACSPAHLWVETSLPPPLRPGSGRAVNGPRLAHGIKDLSSHKLHTLLPHPRRPHTRTILMPRRICLYLTRRPHGPKKFARATRQIPELTCEWRRAVAAPVAQALCLACYQALKEDRHPVHMRIRDAFEIKARPRRTGPGPDRALVWRPARSIMKAHGHLWIQPPGSDWLQPRPGSFGIEPTVTGLIFVKARS